MRNIATIALVTVITTLAAPRQGRAAPIDCGSEQGGIPVFGEFGSCGSSGQASIEVYRVCTNDQTNQSCFIAWYENYDVTYSGSTEGAPLPGYCAAADGTWTSNDVFEDTCE